MNKNKHKKHIKKNREPEKSRVSSAPIEKTKVVSSDTNKPEVKSKTKTKSLSIYFLKSHGESLKQKRFFGLSLMRVFFIFVGCAFLVSGLFFFYVHINRADALEGFYPQNKSTAQSLGDFSLETTPASWKDGVLNGVPSDYFLEIPRIDVAMDVIVNESNERKGLALGAWHLPGTGDPAKNDGKHNNTVISAHRYLYTTGPKTFFRLNELTNGDDIFLLWNREKYHYKVIETKIVQPTDVYILNNSKEKILTLFTCHPVYSTRERYVVIAKAL